MVNRVTDAIRTDSQGRVVLAPFQIWRSLRTADIPFSWPDRYPAANGQFPPFIGAIYRFPSRHPNGKFLEASRCL